MKNSTVALFVPMLIEIALAAPPTSQLPLSEKYAEKYVSHESSNNYQNQQSVNSSFIHTNSDMSTIKFSDKDNIKHSEIQEFKPSSPLMDVHHNDFKHNVGIADLVTYERNYNDIFLSIIIDVFELLQWNVIEILRELFLFINEFLWNCFSFYEEYKTTIKVIMDKLNYLTQV